MDDCEFFGRKHHLKFDHATDMFLIGNLYFKCRNCSTEVIVDRLMFYISLRGKYEPRRNRGS